MRTFLVFLSLIFSIQTLHAECLERNYSADHLKKYSNQEIRSVLLSVADKTYNYDESTGQSTNTAQVTLNIRMIRNKVPIIVETSFKCENIPEDFLFSPFGSQSDIKSFNCANITWTKPKNSEFAATLTLGSQVIFKDVKSQENIKLTKGDSTFNLSLDTQLGSLACQNVLFQPLKVTTPRLWSEVILQSVRYDVARPTVTSRNLFHLSVLLWDIYASFDNQLKTYFLKSKPDLTKINDIQQARETALNYGAYTFLKTRYKLAPGNQKDTHPDNYEAGLGDEKPDQLINTMLDRIQLRLGNDPQLLKSLNTEFDPIEYGITTANSLIEEYKKDGSREEENYSAEKNYLLKNNYNYLDVMQSGVKTPVRYEEQTVGSEQEFITFLGEDFSEKYDIDYWQPMYIPGSLDQNGVEVDSPQAPLTLFWGRLPTFSNLINEKSKDKEGVYFDEEIRLPSFIENQDEFIKQNLAVVDASQSLNPFDFVALEKDFDGDGTFDQNPGAEIIDISPASMGNNNFASNDGKGYSVNPVTKNKYLAKKIKKADFYRSLAEFWADGPRSETPPGHWNVIANYVVDQMQKNNRPFQWMGKGPKISKEQYELMLSLTLNGALYDSGIVAWGLKGYYQGSRPITVIRKLAAMAEKDPAFGKYLEDLSPNVKMVTYKQR